MNEQPLVSVVTPVYNGEAYLAQCIESVLAQSYRAWDLTIVNNRSQDGSLSLARSYAARDPRIRVVDNDQFLAQVPNLNKALSLISPQSRYAKMVLADDWLLPDCLAAMVAVAEQHPSVGLVSAQRWEEDRVTCNGLAGPAEFWSGREIGQRSLLEGLFVFGSATTVLYRSDIVRQRRPFFDEQSLHEDTEACYEILLEHDFGFVHRPLSFTRRQNESETAARRQFDAEHRLDRLIVTLKYGRSYLDEKTYEACLARVEAAYYEFLGQRAMLRGASRFWEYHRRGLAPLGYELKADAVRRARWRALWRELRHPLRLARRVMRKIVPPAAPAGANP